MNRAKMLVGGPLQSSGPQYQTPAYANAGGTGDRTASITVSTTLSVGGGAASLLVNGNTSESVLFVNTQAVSGKVVKFDFGAKKLITEAKYYRSGTDNMGTWKWQGSNDDSAWVDIGSTFTLGGTSPQTQASLSVNTTGYRYYRLLGTADSIAAPSYMREFEFKIGSLLP